MSTTDRQNRLLVAEDWKRIYQSFRNADFQSYDFENLRRVMVSYIRENYPEDFNDYIESSEYLALIDLIAFLGQSLAFRIDLNARDNFLELSERRESILRLARLLSYNAKRNITASGLLKFTTVSTTQAIFDSNGRNLSGQTVSWNDPSNVNWYDQFIKILNAGLPNNRQFGNPDDKGLVYGIPTEQYRFQASNIDVPVYGFNKSVDGRNLPFEIVSTTFKDANFIYEEPPAVGNRIAFVYRNDGRGNGSANTGFFIHFRQGVLNQGTFTIDQPSTNEIVDIDAVNINNDDVWLYKLDADGLESEAWAKIPALEGNNTIYNSLQKSIRNIYSVITRDNDAVSLSFSDGTFGNLPRGTFRAYYRQSVGISYTVNPRDIRNVTIEIPYVSNVNQIETLSISLSLLTSVANSAETEPNDSIKANAPATYYTQNRMITGEDYNISPLGVNQQIVKVKAVNRSSSGISRYFDLVDPTGKYSKTNLFADDGALYREEYTDNFRFAYTTRTDIEAVIYNQLLETLKSKQLRDFYYSKFIKIDAYQDVAWYSKDGTVIDANQSTGYMGSISTSVPYKLGTFTSTLLRFATPGALIKFESTFTEVNSVKTYTHYFDKSNNNALTPLPLSGVPQHGSLYLWCKIISVSGDGTNNGTGTLTDGSGTIILNDVIPNAAILSQVIPAWRTTIDVSTISTMVDLVFANKPFGLRYDIETRTWRIVFEVNLDTASNFSLGKQGDNSNQQLDASWLILFTTDSELYTVTSRLLRYIFESDKQLRFYFDASDKIYDARSNTVVKDKIKVLSINTDDYSISGILPFTYDRDWEITEEYKGLDGYIDTKKIQITFSDTDDDSVVDDPSIFDDIVTTDSYVFLELYIIEQGQEDYRWFDNSQNIVIVLNSQPVSTTSYLDGQYFYFVDTNTVKRLEKSTGKFIVSLDYKVYTGRSNIKFQYIHNADYESRVDPGLTNLVDMFILTKDYDKVFREWLADVVTTEPLPPSSDFLYNLLSTDLNKIKSISDEIIYHPVKYKVLFGPKASPDIQAVFKIVKNGEVVISDNDVKSKVLSAINEFFALENWDFGSNFYFTELSAYVMNRLAPNIVNFIIVPKQPTLTFGSLYEIQSEKDQIFINGATVNDIEIISSITASKLKSAGPISITSTTNSQQIITSAGNN
jgi:hypothetical protein